MPGLIGEQGRQMARRRRSAVQRDPARQVLAVALSLLGLAALLFAVSAVLGSGTGGMLKPVGQGLRTPVPFLLVLGVALLALHAFLRSRQRPAEPASQAHPFSHEKIIEPVIERQTVRVLQDSEAALGSCKPSGSGQWTMDVFHGIEWRRFEAVCATFFAQAGFEPRSQSHGADGGVDIWLHSKPVEGPVAVVQCKHWVGKPVGVKEMRALFGVMAARKVAHGTFVTTSTITADARAFAKENGIHALDGAALLALIRKRSPVQQADLLRIAHEGEYWRPTCASCGTKMVQREARKTGSAFWGCTNYPRCRSTLPLRAGT